MRPVAVAIRTSGEVDLVYITDGSCIGGMLAALERAVNAKRIGFVPVPSMLPSLAAGGYVMAFDDTWRDKQLPANFFAELLLVQNQNPPPLRPTLRHRIAGDVVVFRDPFSGHGNGAGFALDLNALVGALTPTAPGLAVRLTTAAVKWHG